MSVTIDAGHLRLYSPEQGDHEACGQPELRLWTGANGIGLLADEEGHEEGPLVFPFPPRGVFSCPQTQEQLLSRMKTVYKNRTCHACQAPGVIPLQKNDDLLNRNRMPIPGTATLVGFRCHRCSAEWGA